MVLVQAGKVLTQNTREADTLGRWDGEEFLIVLPYTDLGQACALAEKLRLTISELMLPVVAHKTCSFGFLLRRRRFRIALLADRKAQARRTDYGT